MTCIDLLPRNEAVRRLAWIQLRLDQADAQAEVNRRAMNVCTATVAERNAAILLLDRAFTQLDAASAAVAAFQAGAR